MFIKLPLQKLKEFTDLSKSLQSSELEQIYQFIKVEIDFGKCTITKSTRDSFLVYTFDLDAVDDCSFIIQEKVLSDFSNSTNENYVYIELNESGGNIHKIKDSLNSKKCYEKVFNDGGYKIKDFPSSHVKLDSITYSRLGKNQIDSILRAKSFVGKDDLAPMYNHIFISPTKPDPNKNGKSDLYINSFGGQTMYLDRIGSDLSFPFLAISPRESAIITKFEWLDYNSDTSNFNIYKYGLNGEVIYGFSRVEGANPVDLSLPLSMFKKDNYFIIKTNDILKFCTSIKLYSGTNDKDREDSKWKNSSCTLDFGECTLFFELEKISESIKVICDVTVVGSEFNFNFNQNFLYEIIRGAFSGYDEICISDSGNGVCIFSRNHENMIGFMMKYQKQAVK